MGRSLSHRGVRAYAAVLRREPRGARAEHLLRRAGADAALVPRPDRRFFPASQDPENFRTCSGLKTQLVRGLWSLLLIHQSLTLSEAKQV